MTQHHIQCHSKVLREGQQAVSMMQHPTTDSHNGRLTEKLGDGVHHLVNKDGPCQPVFPIQLYIRPDD